MLQFYTSISSGLTLPDQVKLAVSGGCRWIRIPAGADAQQIQQVTTICQEADAILIIDNDIEIVEQLRVHGLHLTKWSRRDVIAAREKLGPHAILGLSCHDSMCLEELKGLDVDYVTIPVPPGGNPVDFYSSFMEEFNKLRPSLSDGAVAGMTLHPVASGDFSIDSLPSLTATGIEGIEMSAEILAAPDPVSFINLAIQTLYGDR